MAVHSSLVQLNQKCNVKSDITIPIAQIDSYPELVAERREFSVFKIKLEKSSLDDSIGKIRAVKEIRPDATIRIDPNQD